MLEKMTIDVVGREQGNDSDEGLPSGSDEDSDEEYDRDLDFQEDPNKISMKHEKHINIEERAAEDMEFPDEVDTPFDDARTIFNKYRGIKSLRNCDWDPYENLPAEYSKIWRFQSYVAAQKDSVAMTVDEGLPLNGTYINIVLEIPSDVEAAKVFSLN